MQTLQIFLIIIAIIRNFKRLCTGCLVIIKFVLKLSKEMKKSRNYAHKFVGYKFI